MMWEEAPPSRLPKPSLHASFLPPSPLPAGGGNTAPVCVVCVPPSTAPRKGPSLSPVGSLFFWRALEGVEAASAVENDRFRLQTMRKMARQKVARLLLDHAEPKAQDGQTILM